MVNYLNDKNFLKKICSTMNRALSVKITSYTKDDEPIETIEGKVSSGSINIDGSSSSRRSCSLTILTENLNIHDFYWSLTTRFQVELGILNTTNEYTNYNIIWFPMGYYLISSFSISVTTTGASISIQGKDKMNLLNGDMGGKLAAETNFGIEDIISEDGTVTHYKIPIKQIIKEMVHIYGGEHYSNIIINDVDDYGFNLETYYGDNPFWIIIPVEKYKRLSDSYIITNPNELFYNSNDDRNYMLFEIPEEDLWYQDSIVSEESGTIFQKTNTDEDQYYIRKISYGDTCCYLLTDLIYNGELIGKAGETITSILDKIKNMLGDYEYFYDTNGNFIFQQQKAYKSKGEKQLTTDQDGIIVDYTYEDIDLTLTDLSLLTSLSNNVQINNLKNDFCVWGQKDTVNGGTVPIHMRYAIDKRPTETYHSIAITPELKETCLLKYPKESKGLVEKNSIDFDPNVLDWREIIYQMALDHQKLHFTDEYFYLLSQYNPSLTKGKTGYEQYYIDLLGFWRQLYNPFWQDLEYTVNSKIQDLFLPDYFFTFVDKDVDNFYLTNKNVSNNLYTTINKSDINNLIFDNNNNYEYLYGPLIPTESGGTRNLYGNLKDIIKMNYLILFKFYAGKILNQYNNNLLEDNKFNHLKENCYLYIYDASTCIPNINNDINKIDQFTNFIQADNLQCYHKILDNGKVEPYYIWDSSADKSGKQAIQKDLFTDILTVYEKVYYSESEYHFIQLGTYYPITCNDLVSLTEEEQYKIATLDAKDFLRSELKSVDPNNYLEIVDNFNNMFIEKKELNNWTYAQQYGIIALYQNIIAYYVPLLLSFLKPIEVSVQDILNQTEKSSLIQDLDKEWLYTIFISEIINFLRNNNNNNNQNMLNFITNILDQQIQIDEDSLTATEKMQRSQLIEALKKLRSFIASASLNVMSFPFTLLSNVLRGNNNNNISIPVFTDEEKRALANIFTAQYRAAQETMTNLKQQIGNQVLTKIITDAEKNRENFQAYLYSSSFYQIFSTQVKYNFSNRILTQEDFNLECNKTNALTELNFITPYNNINLFKIKDTNYYFLFNKLYNQEKIDSNLDLIHQILQINLLPNMVINENLKNKKVVIWPKNFDLFTYWNKDINEAPDKLLFWFDFLDNPSDNLYKYSVKNIGQRPYVATDTQVKVMKYLPNLDIALIDVEQNYDLNKLNVFKSFHDGYQYINTKNSTDTTYNALNVNNFSISANGKSAFVAMENLLYNYGYATEAISISCIPQYFLQPNTKMAIYDATTRINGEYIISKISIPLTYNGLMSITATKAINKFERSEIYQ